MERFSFRTSLASLIIIGISFGASRIMAQDNTYYRFIDFYNGTVYSATGDNFNNIQEYYIENEHGWVETNGEGQYSAIIGNYSYIPNYNYDLAILTHPAQREISAATVAEYTVSNAISMRGYYGFYFWDGFGEVRFVIEVIDNGVTHKVLDKVLSDESFAPYEVSFSEYTSEELTIRLITDPIGDAGPDQYWLGEKSQDLGYVWEKFAKIMAKTKPKTAT